MEVTATCANGGWNSLLEIPRIAQLYEGTNGIQAADLIGRKLTRDGGDMQQATFNLFVFANNCNDR